jgi:hypothetical protein
VLMVAVWFNDVKTLAITNPSTAPAAPKPAAAKPLAGCLSRVR